MIPPYRLSPQLPRPAMTNAEPIAMKAANISQYVGSGTAVVFGLSSSEWQVIGIIVGIAVGIGGFSVNLYFKWRHYQLAREFKVGLDD